MTPITLPTPLPFKTPSPSRALNHALPTASLPAASRASPPLGRREQESRSGALLRRLGLFGAVLGRLLLVRVSRIDLARRLLQHDAALGAFRLRPQQATTSLLQAVHDGWDRKVSRWAVGARVAPGVR